MMNNNSNLITQHKTTKTDIKKIEKKLKRNQKKKMIKNLKKAGVTAINTGLSIAGVDTSIVPIVRKAVNSLAKGKQNKPQLKDNQISNRLTNTGSCLALTGSEFFTNVYASVDVFYNTAYQVNIGNQSMFPLASQIFQNYTEYQFESLKIIYRPLVSSTSTSGAMGEILLSVNYNPGLPLYGTKREVLDSEGSQSFRPCDNGVLKVDCKRKHNQVEWFLVGSGSLNTGQNINLYNFISLQVAQSSIPLNVFPDGTLLGEIWLDYKVKGEKIRLYQALGKANMYYSVCSQTSGSNGMDSSNLFFKPKTQLFSPGNNMIVYNGYNGAHYNHLYISPAFDGMWLRFTYIAKSQYTLMTSLTIGYSQLTLNSDLISTNSTGSLVAVSGYDVINGTTVSIIRDFIMTVDTTASLDPYISLAASGLNSANFICGWYSITVMNPDSSDMLEGYGPNMYAANTSSSLTATPYHEETIELELTL